jgi:LysR family hca operon transcriptional activator
MDLRYLRFFIAVAEEMNVTRAAERLHTVQPSVSRQIHRLEEIVGTPLFRRERHKLFLTDAGSAFLRESRAILEQVDHAMEQARQAARTNNHRVSVGFILGTEGPIFSRLVPTLRKKHPEMQISYRSLTELEMLTALDNKTINAAFCAGPIVHPGVAAECVLHQKLVVVLPSDHPLAEMKRIPCARLAEIPLIIPSPATSPNYIAFINQVARAAGIQLKTFIECDNVMAALSSVSIGSGACLIPDYQQGFLPDHFITRSLELDPQPTLDMLVVYRKDDKLPALKAFLAAVRECLAAPVQFTAPPATPVSTPLAEGSSGRKAHARKPLA